MITQIIRKRLFCVTHVSNSETIDACNWRVHRKYLMKAPNYTKEFVPESPV